ncbi:hypothetical protein D9613_012526 [Agrocybe pediades]|uniref:DUF6533 domain-containing protein n=1 Tax=Agrocybe pediades TaxID=84607 RepID=A0A8H4QRS3_9AGAR|nr:hypothetical protein D9613_012526 [Agrocybe pediades]
MQFHGACVSSPIMSSFNILLERSVASLHALRQTQIDTYAAYSRITLWTFDLLINLDREQELIWSEGLRASSLLYYAVRYPVIARQIFYVCYTGMEYVSQVRYPFVLGSKVLNCKIADVQTLIAHCNLWYQFVSVWSLLIPRVAIALSFILRVYAVMHGGRFYVAILSFLGLFSSVLDIVQIKQISCTEMSNPLGESQPKPCPSDAAPKLKVNSSLTKPPLAFVMTFISLIVFDVIACTLILWKMVEVIRQQGGFRTVRRLADGSIATLIIQNGALYFIIITGIQLGAVILYFLPQPSGPLKLIIFKGLYSTVLNDYTLIISTILVARLILDLKGYFRRTSRPGIEAEPYLTSLSFAENGTELGVSTGQRTTISGQWVHGLVRDFEGSNAVGARETRSMSEMGDVGRR